MAMRARVELRSALSHLGRRKFFKGTPQILTNPSEIAYYKAQGGFSVSMMATEKTKAMPSSTGDDGDGGVEGTNYSKTDLEKLTKAQLMDLGAEEYELELDVDDKKSTLVDALLAAQEEMVS